MTVKELIAELQKHNPNATVIVWDAYMDCESENVEVTEDCHGKVMIWEK